MNPTPRSHPLNPRGLALVHMMIATGITSALIVGAGLYVAYQSVGHTGENPWRTTVEELDELHHQVLEYRRVHCRLPPSLAALSGATPQDPWGNPYVYRPRNDGTFMIYSLGSDGTPGTIEDVHLNARWIAR